MTQRMIENPILRGFNPDPSILRVGGDFYVATSTFEWFPGVQIHHSRDLLHWRLLSRALDRTSQLDMRGDPSSGGIWAPCLSHADGVFYLAFTDVKTMSRTKDMHNCLVTATDIAGPWSEPVYLHSRGFDPSLFHDDDGRMWLVSMVWDHRLKRNRFGGIVLQEYSARERGLTGPARIIYSAGTGGLLEGPHLYKRKGWYYLLMADGGTGLNHCAVMARSRSLEGPYQPCPWNPIITSRTDPSLPLQKAGHASMTDTPDGEWYMVHLCGRPIPSVGRYPLGRETGIQKIEWTEDGWIRLAGGGNTPRLEVPAPDLPEHPFPQAAARDDFDQPVLGMEYQSLRVPLGSDALSLAERPGWLRLKGGESLASRHRQSLIARRWQAFRFTAGTRMEFRPSSFQQMAGLVCIHDVSNWYYLRVGHDEKAGRSLGIVTCVNGALGEPLAEEAGIEGWDAVHLRVEVDWDKLQFSFSRDGGAWSAIGPVLDASLLSDECSADSPFTGAFVGLCCQDFTGERLHADFDWFEYRER